MQGDPILACRTLPAGTNGYRVPLTLRVEGGLHYMRGNSSPYFSLTCTTHRKGHPTQCQGGGAAHETILKYYPQFADLAALHLSDIDGVPMHAEANGWYWLAGALGGLGERFHGGSGEFGRSWGECLEIFGRLVRLPEGETWALLDTIDKTMVLHGKARAREVWAAIVEAMRPRWKAESDTAIARHGLVVYGDPWPPKAEPEPAGNQGEGSDG